MNNYIQHGDPRRQLGLSLIELMISLVVGLLLLGGLIQIYLSSKQSYNAQEQLARMQESGRFAMDLITTDLRRSGYWGGSVDLRRIEAGVPGAITNTTTPPVSHTCAANTNWGRMIRWRVSGLNNTNAGYTCAAGYDATIASDILAVRYAGPAPVAPPLDSTRLYLRDNTDSGVIMTGADAGAAENEPAGIVGDSVDAVVRPLVSHAYYIGNSGRTCPGGVAIPALMRVRLGEDGLPTTPEEIASGVEALEVQYLLGEEYLNANEIDDDDWLLVSAVRVWLLVRAECVEQGLVNDTVYAMGDQVVGPDNIRRQLYVSTVMLRNSRVGDVL